MCGLLTFSVHRIVSDVTYVVTVHTLSSNSIHWFSQGLYMTATLTAFVREVFAMYYTAYFSPLITIVISIYCTELTNCKRCNEN